MSHTRIQGHSLAAGGRAEGKPHAGAASGRADHLDPRPGLPSLFRVQGGSEQKSKICGAKGRGHEVVQMSWPMLP